jgi:hypothetical protein
MLARIGVISDFVTAAQMSRAEKIPGRTTASRIPHVGGSCPVFANGPRLRHSGFTHYGAMWHLY